MDFFDAKTQHFILGVGGLLALLTVGYYAILGIRRSMIENGPADGAELLDPLRAAYQRGSMGTDEFERVQAMLGNDRPATLEDELFAARRRKAARANLERGPEAPELPDTDADSSSSPDGLRTGGSGDSPPGSD